MSVPSLTLLVLKTRQVEKLRSFYLSLGVELAEERHGSGPVHFAGKVGDLTFEVYPLGEDGGLPEASTRLGFAVDGLADVIGILEESGSPVISRPKETRWGVRAVVRDPDGRAVELYERR
jgi:lactoylglutathione lyase